MNQFEPLDQQDPINANASNHIAKVQNLIQTNGTILENLLDFARSIPDFRRHDRGNFHHPLADIIILMILGRMVGKTGRSDIIEFGKYNLKWFHKLGLLKKGVPSEPTICRVENGINDIVMAERLRIFIQRYQEEFQKAGCNKEEIICIDGKATRGTVLANGRNPDIVSAYCPDTGIVLATEACQEKSNEIKAVPLLLDKIDVSGKTVTADAMSMQKDIIDRIKSKGGDFMIELKANQRSLRYGVEDRLKTLCPVYSYTIGPELGHGRIETRTYRIYDGFNIMVDKEKWGSNLTVVEYESVTVKKSTGVQTQEKRLYISNMPAQTPHLGHYVRRHWAIESMHWGLDVNLRQDKIKRKYPGAARNLDTIQRLVFSVFSIWKDLRKKRSDKRKGVAQLMRLVSMSFTSLMNFLRQK